MIEPSCHSPPKKVCFLLSIRLKRMGIVNDPLTPLALCHSTSYLQKVGQTNRPTRVIVASRRRTNHRVRILGEDIGKEWVSAPSQHVQRKSE